ncbi:hypothetical protein OK074_4184 [Actinobacteria bacterium OK074]|nr:hypothetical protein OK074_4184 [Actinobacteria bacterium OK074]
MNEHEHERDDETRDGYGHGFADDGFPDDDPALADDEAFTNDEALADDLLEETLRGSVAVHDPVPAELERAAVAAYALHDLDAQLAELTFDSLLDAMPVRGTTLAPRMLTFRAGDLTVDVELTTGTLMGQLLPPGPARVEILTGGPAGAPTVLTADILGRFTCDRTVTGPFALRVRTDTEAVVTEWLFA